MSRPRLNDIVGAVPRLPEEEPPAITLPPTGSIVTMILLNADTEKLSSLQQLGYIESYVICPQVEDNIVEGVLQGRKARYDAQGVPLVYVSVLLTDSQLQELRVVNRTYRIVETAQLVAATKDQVPDFARTSEGGPAHVFFGIPFGEEIVEVDDGQA